MVAYRDHPPDPVPEYLTLDNLLYPALAIASLPFLTITLHHLLQEEPVVMQLSNAAAVATMIFVPFTFTQVLRDILTTTVVNQAVWLLQVLDHPVQVEGWNIIIRNEFATEIILACTGITAIAILLVILIVIASGLFRIILQLAIFARALENLYLNEITRIATRIATRIRPVTITR